MRNIALITSYNLNKAFDKFHNCSYENTANDCHRRMFELSLFKFFFFLIQFYRQPNQNKKYMKFTILKLCLVDTSFSTSSYLDQFLRQGLLELLTSILLAFYSIWAGQNILIWITRNKYPSFLLNRGRLEYFNRGC